MAKKTAKKSKPVKKPNPLSLGPIRKSMEAFLTASSKSKKPAVVEARHRIKAMLEDFPLCFDPDYPPCKQENPPEGCGFVPVAPK